MQTTILRVSTARFLNYEKFREFANTEENRSKFHLDGPGGDDLTVSTWFCNELVDAYKATMTEEEARNERKNEIEKMYAQMKRTA